MFGKFINAIVGSFKFMICQFLTTVNSIVGGQVKEKNNAMAAQLKFDPPAPTSF